MPKELEDKLKKEARARGFGDKKSDAYVYGTLRKTGWTPHKTSNGNTKKVVMKGYDKPKC